MLFLTARAYPAGNASAAFLRLGIGARNTAMGETGAAEAGANAVNWNPAGLTRAEKSEVSFMYAQWLEGIRFQNISFASPRKGGAVGISATYLGVPSTDKYDNTGLKLGDSYQASDLSVSVAYARVMNTLPLGVNVKFVSSQIDGSSASALALDAGLLLNSALHLQSENITVGLAVQNLGTGMKFNRESFSLPLNLRLGGTYVPKPGITLALDFNKPLDSDLAVNAGAEYTFAVSEGASLAGRAGYRTNTKGQGGLAGLTAGVGVMFGQLGFDYAFVPYGDLDSTHRVSLNYLF
ncbi:MAG: PorV/PorQ family protein [Endomicrobiales bacterium]